MKILINTPDLSLPGGVANHYKGLKPFWTKNVIYNFIGRRKNADSSLVLMYDYMKFTILCAFCKYDVILLNPSLGKTAIKRDALFLKIAKKFKIKVIVFFHGWNQNLALEISKDPKDFIDKFKISDGIIVLASAFKTQLENWGVTNPIYLSTTKVDDKLITGFEITKKEQTKTILFLARIEDNKGVFIAIEAFNKIKLKYEDAQLLVAGEGNALEEARQLTKRLNLEGVTFLGSISGAKLINTFTESSIYILPTTHGEGLPTSVLEAMAFGLPIVSRPVGGLIDFFEEKRMGFLLESLSPLVYYEKLEWLLSNPTESKDIGLNNHEFAKKNFMASKVSLELERILIN